MSVPTREPEIIPPEHWMLAPEIHDMMTPEERAEAATYPNRMGASGYWIDIFRAMLPPERFEALLARAKVENSHDE